MNYFRRWNCEVCGEREESVDTPKVKVCERCSGEQGARQDMQMYEFERQLRKAYERGYRHGQRRYPGMSRNVLTAPPANRGDATRVSQPSPEASEAFRGDAGGAQRDSLTERTC